MKSPLIMGIISALIATSSLSAYADNKKPAPVDPCAGLPMDSLVNGSFEQLNTTIGINNGVKQKDIVSLKTWDIYQSVAGWTSVDHKGIELWGGGFNGVIPSQGNVLMEIKGNEPNVVSQSFCSRGGEKSISLDVYARTGTFGDNVVNVVIDGKQIMHIDPAHKFFKTYEENVKLSKGLHTLTLTSAQGTNYSMGGLIDNIKITDGSCHDRHAQTVGVSTILLALSEITKSEAVNIIGDALEYVKPVHKPLVLFVRSAFHNNESLSDFTIIPKIMKDLGYNVTVVDEPVTGLKLETTSGYDVVWFNNPGYPEQSQKTLDTLVSLAKNRTAGVVLSGDDLSSNQYVNMSSLTKMVYGNNGTSACGTAIDNNATPNKYVVFYDHHKFLYGNDIDQDSLSWAKVSHKKGKMKLFCDQSRVSVPAWASTSVSNCRIDIPVIVQYKVKK